MTLPATLGAMWERNFRLFGDVEAVVCGERRWTYSVLADRARRYGLTVEQYKTNNVLGVEVTSRDVADLACAMAGPLFAKTTGAQLPVDGGNDRVI